MLFACLLFLLLALLIVRYLILKKDRGRCAACPFQKDCEKMKKNG